MYNIIPRSARNYCLFGPDRIKMVPMTTNNAQIIGLVLVVLTEALHA
jgi:hypothetical protein